MAGSFRGGRGLSCGTIANGADFCLAGESLRARGDILITIVHSDEIQPMSGRSSPGRGACPRRKHRAHVGAFVFLSHFHKCSHQGAYHLFKEPVGIEGEDDEIALAAQIRLLQSALGISIVGRRSFK